MGKEFDLYKKQYDEMTHCEWKHQGNSLRYKTNCGYEIVDFPHDWKFCPYCGKKIKRVKNGKI